MDKSAIKLHKTTVADPLSKALGLVGKKYELLIIYAIFSNKKRAGFNHLMKAIPALNPRILSIRLKALEKNKLVTKSIVLGTPVKTEYALTPKAEELISIIEKLNEWANKH